MATGLPPDELDAVLSNLQIKDVLESCDAENYVSLSRSSLSCLKKSSKFRLTLDLDLDAREIIPKSVPRGQQLKGQTENKPIHLKFFMPNCSGSVPVIDFNDVQFKMAETFNKLITTVQTLCELFGSECIQDFTFIYPRPYINGFFQKLTKVLSDVSPGLEKLEINLDYEFSFTAWNGNEWEWMVLPKVKHLNFDWGNEHCRFLGVDDYPEFSGSAWTLIYACPNLETLVVGTGNVDEDRMNMENWPTDLPFPPAGIKSFEYKNFPAEWLFRQMMQHPSLPALENLCVKNFRIIKGDDEGRREGWILHCRREILRLFSPSLISLSIPLMAPFTPSGVKPVPVHPVPFPVFPVLRNLTILNLNDRFGSKFKIDPAAFPVLESLEIPYEIIWTTGSLKDETEQGQAAAAGQGQNQFPSVKQLTLRFSLLRDDDNDEDVTIPKENEDKKSKIVKKFQYFQKTFPNISTIGFRNSACYGMQCYGLERGARIKQYLKIFLQLPRNSKIEVLELVDFDQNYLGELLEQIRHPPRLVLENLTNPLLDNHLLKIFGELTDTRESEVKISTKVMIPADESDVYQTIVEHDLRNPPFENCLKNVQKIRLVLTPEAQIKFVRESNSNQERADRKTISSDPKKLYLSEMMTNFPCLEEIDVSSDILTHGYSRPGLAKRIETIQKKFAGLKINII